MNKEIMDKLINKRTEECVPSCLPDNIINFLYENPNDRQASIILKHYAFSIYCFSKQVYAFEVTHSISINDQIYETYRIHLMFERIRRLKLISYEPPTAANFYTRSLSDTPYIKTTLFKNIFGMKNETE